MNDPALIPSSNQNACTGDHLITKPSSPAYRAGWDRIFGKPKEDPPNTEDSEVFETTEELYKSWGYHDCSEDKPRNKWIR